MWMKETLIHFILEVTKYIQMPIRFSFFLSIIVMIFCINLTNCKFIWSLMIIIIMDTSYRVQIVLQNKNSMRKHTPFTHIYTHRHAHLLPRNCLPRFVKRPVWTFLRSKVYSWVFNLDTVGRSRRLLPCLWLCNICQLFWVVFWNKCL